MILGGPAPVEVLDMLPWVGRPGTAGRTRLGRVVTAGLLALLVSSWCVAVSQAANRKGAVEKLIGAVVKARSVLYHGGLSAAGRRRIMRDVATIVDKTELLSTWRAVARKLDRAVASRAWYPLVSRGGVVMMFHRITDRADPFRAGFDVDLFEHFSRHLARHYEVLTLDGMEHRRTARGDLSRVVALTFDDGYADNYRLALPILRKYQLPATVFVTTGAVDGTAPLWFAHARWIIEHARPNRPTAGEIDGVVLRFGTLQERVDTAERLVDRLRLWDPAARDALLDGLARRLNVSRNAPGLQHDVLTWDQLREMDKAGFSAQPHTVSHPILSRLSPEAVDYELKAAKERVESELDRPADILAYPNGHPEDFTPDVVQAVGRAGYRMAYTGDPPAAVRPSDDPFTLPRLGPYADTPATSALHLERLFYLRMP